jgi:hypothetical protein
LSTSGNLNGGASGSVGFSSAGATYLFNGGNFYPAVNSGYGCGVPGNAWYQCAAYNFPNPSDPRDKEAMIPAPPGALGKIQALGVHQFRYKTDATKRVHIGFNADEVEALHPHAVFIGKDEAGTKAVNMPDMIALLWQAVQELTAKVAELEAGTK